MEVAVTSFFLDLGWRSMTETPVAALPSNAGSTTAHTKLNPSSAQDIQCREPSRVVEFTCRSSANRLIQNTE
jgi:hypothetical protein